MNKSRQTPYSREGERGVAIVEFSLAAIVFFMILGFIIDMGLGIYHANIVNRHTLNAARQVTRDFALKIVPRGCTSLDDIDGSRCNDLARCAERVIRASLKDTPGIAERTQINASLDEVVAAGGVPAPAGEPAYYMLTTSASYAGLCTFCGMFSKLGFKLGSKVMMQNQLVCSG